MIKLERNNVMLIHSLEVRPEDLKGIWANPDSLGNLQ